MEAIVIHTFENLRRTRRKTKIDEFREYVEGMSACLSGAILVQLARFGMEDEVFAAFTRLAEADPRVMSLACEYLQVNLFNEDLNGIPGKQSGLCRDQKLNLFRLAQRIRDEHGTTRETSSPKCFRSFEDIVELERGTETNNCVGFMIQCMRLDMVANQHIDQMFESTSTVEQLAALYDEGVLMLERFRRYPHEEKQPYLYFRFNRYDLGIRFQRQFEKVSEPRPCERPWWQDSKMYLERATALGESDVFTSDLDIPDANVDEALSCLLSNQGLFTYCSRYRDFEYLLISLLSRGASLYHKDQHGVSSLRRFLGLVCRFDVCFPLQTLSTYICCPLKYEGGKIIADNRRLAPLSCLAARRIPPSTSDEHLPSQLRPFVRSHREPRGKPVESWKGDGWRFHGHYDPHNEWRRSQRNDRER